MNERDSHCPYSLSNETAAKGWFTANHYLICYLAFNLIVERSVCELETILTQLQNLFHSQDYKVNVRLHHQVDSRPMFLSFILFSPAL